MPTREELRIFFEATAAELAPPIILPPTMGATLSKLTIHDVQLKPSDLVARVPITLSEPTKVTMAIQVATANGTGMSPASEGTNFTRTIQWIIFHPGDQAKIVSIPVKSSMAEKHFTLGANLQQGHWDGSTALPILAKSKGTIYGPGAAIPAPFTTPVVDATNTNLPSKPNVTTKVFEELFTDFQASDSGFLSDGITPCWHSKQGIGLGNPNPNIGRQHFNGEVDWISDPVLNPGTEPWFVDPLDGKFKLQAKHWPDGVPGAPLTTGGTAQWFYSSALVTTKRLFKDIGVGCYIEMRMKLPRTLGCWPAGWILINDGGMIGNTYAPFIEFDLIEGFFNNTTDLRRWSTAYHFRNSNNGHDSIGTALQYTTIDPDIPHTFGLWWGERKLVSYIDDIPYFQIPNMTPLDKMAYLKLNLALGGAGGTPIPENFPVTMPIEFVRIWR